MKTPLEIPIGEYGFWDLAEEELTVCRDYEFGREHALGRKHAIDVRLKAMEEARKAADKDSKPHSPNQLFVVYPDLKDLVLSIRKNWKGVNLESISSEPAWHQSFEARVLVLYPEWPKLPYLSISREKRLRRLKRSFSELTEPADLAILVSKIQRDLRKMEKAKATTEAGLLLEQLPSVARLIQPNWDGPKCVRTIAIPQNVEGVPPIYRRDIEAAFSAWLRIHFPELPDYKTRGRANELTRVVDDLNALAVYRLRRAGKKLSEIANSVRHPGSGPNGSRSYSSIKKLDSPQRRLPARMMNFYVQVLNQLEPLEPEITNNCP